MEGIQYSFKRKNEGKSVTKTCKLYVTKVIAWPSLLMVDTRNPWDCLSTLHPSSSVSLCSAAFLQGLLFSWKLILLCMRLFCGWCHSVRYSCPGPGRFPELPAFCTLSSPHCSKRFASVHPTRMNPCGSPGIPAPHLMCVSASRLRTRLQWSQGKKGLPSLASL